MINTSYASTERQLIEAAAKQSGWGREDHQITTVFRRTTGVTITVEWAGPRDGYERFSSAKRRDDYGTVATLRVDRLADWLISPGHSNEPTDPIGPM